MVSCGCGLEISFSLDQPGVRAQRGVTDRMTMEVVDEFEVVEVKPRPLTARRRSATMGSGDRKE